MASSIAQTEPFPFVPATWMMRSFGAGKPNAARRRRIVLEPELDPEALGAEEPGERFAIVQCVLEK